MATLTIGLAGNPNAGKTTLFNELTGARQHVGNYPGVTVEKKEGVCRRGDYELHIVDLPGTYSLSANSVEELIAREFVVQERPDVIVDVVDASNLERNLYLTTQFIELDQPTVVALNMMDEAESSGRSIDHALLSELFGVPMVPIVARRGEGTDALLDAVIAVAENQRRPAVQVNFGPELEPHVREVTDLVAQTGACVTPECTFPGEALLPVGPRWIAIKLLEGDPAICQRTEREFPDAVELLAAVVKARAHIRLVIGDDPEVAIADRRYGFISGATREALHHDQLHRVDWSEAVDRVVASRVLGLPLFAVLMWGMFFLVFRLGAPPMRWIESLFTALSDEGSRLLPAGELRSLIVDGVLGGVGGVLTFVPNIMLLFLAISVLEDTGYMARAAFVVDRVMHRIGLHGKSFIPLLIGFGCTVPAVLATRTLDQRRDRLVTMLVAPLMSCGARLPVYVLLAGAFFAPNVAGQVIFSIYVLGVIMALTMAFLFRRFLFTGPTTPFVMELPPYRLPTLRGLVIHVWERAWQYIKKAGTVILGFAIVVWFLMSYPKLPAPTGAAPGVSHASGQEAMAYSFAGRLGKAIEPALRPLGFDWRIGVALIAGLGAKEVVVSTLATSYKLSGDEANEESLREALAKDPKLSPLTAVAFMVFVLLYVPCLSTVAVIWRESGSWKWPVFTVAYTCALAWLGAFVVHTAGTLLGWGT